MTIIIFILIMMFAILKPEILFPLLIPVGTALCVIFSLIAIAGYLGGL